MFKLQPDPTFEAAASIPVPGQKKPAKLDLVFRWLTREGIRAYFEDLEGKTDLEALLEIVTDWQGVEGEKGKVVPFTPESFAQLLDAYPGAAMAIFDVYRREAFGAKEKN